MLVSSSIEMKMNPLAVSGLCLAMTQLATRTISPSLRLRNSAVTECCCNAIPLLCEVSEELSKSLSSHQAVQNARMVRQPSTIFSNMAPACRCPARKGWPLHFPATPTVAATCAISAHFRTDAESKAATEHSPIPARSEHCHQLLHPMMALHPSLCDGCSFRKSSLRDALSPGDKPSNTGERLIFNFAGLREGFDFSLFRGCC